MQATHVPLIDAERVLCQRHLRDFVEAAWHVVEPSTPFVGNWHIDAICDHLEAVTRGEIDNLLINVPPGCMKSLLVSVLWPAWEWATTPGLRYLCVSYDEQLSVRDNRRVRDLVLSDWYQERWPRVQLSTDQNQKTRFDTTESGWRIGTSVGGRGLGEHPDRKIIDDPHKTKEADSDAERMRALDNYDGTLASRGKARGAKTVCIMQRLHERDLSGHLLEKGGWVHINLPMRFESGAMRTTPIGFNDPRTSEGDLLWPDLFSESVVSSLERDMGSYRAAGQLQQRPAPAEGGLLKRAWWQFYHRRPPLQTIVLSWDTALKAKTTNDYTVGQAWGQSSTADRYLLRVDRGKWDEPEMERRMTEQYTWARETFPKAKITLLIENAAAGANILRRIKRTLPGVVGVDVDKDKVLRVHAASPALEAGNCWLPGAALPNGYADTAQTPAWVQDFIAECAAFPNATYDDQVDAFTQAMARFDAPQGPRLGLVQPTRATAKPHTIRRPPPGSLRSRVARGEL